MRKLGKSSTIHEGDLLYDNYHLSFVFIKESGTWKTFAGKNTRVPVIPLNRGWDNRSGITFAGDESSLWCNLFIPSKTELYREIYKSRAVAIGLKDKIETEQQFQWNLFEPMRNPKGIRPV